MKQINKKTARGTPPAVVLDGCRYPLTETCHIDKHLFLTVLFYTLYAFFWRCRFPTRSLFLIKYSQPQTSYPSQAVALHISWAEMLVHRFLCTRLGSSSHFHSSVQTNLTSGLWRSKAMLWHHCTLYLSLHLVCLSGHYFPHHWQGAGWVICHKVDSYRL